MADFKFLCKSSIRSTIKILRLKLSKPSLHVRMEDKICVFCLLGISATTTANFKNTGAGKFLDNILVWRSLWWRMQSNFRVKILEHVSFVGRHMKIYVILDTASCIRALDVSNCRVTCSGTTTILLAAIVSTRFSSIYHICTAKCETTSRACSSLR